MTGFVLGSSVYLDLRIQFTAQFNSNKGSHVYEYLFVGSELGQNEERKKMEFLFDVSHPHPTSVLFTPMHKGGWDFVTRLCMSRGN